MVDERCRIEIWNRFPPSVKQGVRTDAEHRKSREKSCW